MKSARPPASVSDVFVQIVNDTNIGVVEGRGSPRLALESSEMVRIPGELFRQHFDGNFSPEFRILRTPHFTYTSFTQEREELVMTEFGAEFHV